mgnify:CR=1 FL=1
MQPNDKLTDALAQFVAESKTLLITSKPINLLNCKHVITVRYTLGQLVSHDFRNYVSPASYSNKYLIHKVGHGIDKLYSNFTLPGNKQFQSAINRISIEAEQLINKHLFRIQSLPGGKETINLINFICLLMDRVIIQDQLAERSSNLLGTYAYKLSLMVAVVICLSKPDLKYKLFSVFHSDRTPMHTPQPYELI